MEEERDIVVFSDDEGNEFELDVIDYFEHEGQEYAVLMDLAAQEGEDEDEDCDCQAEQDVYIMKVVVTDDIEEFLPADEDKMEELAAIVEQRLSEECDCGCEDEDCDCDEEGCGCGCGCGCGDEK